MNSTPLPYMIRSLATLLFVALLGLVASSPLNAQLVSLPQASPAATVSQTIGITEVSVEYSRPSVNGRTIWGGLVPYGFSDLGWADAENAPWRAGANRNTVITLQHDAELEGKPVPAGSYGLHIAVEESGEALIILSRNSDSWGSYFYDPAEDVLRVSVETETAPHREQLLYEFTNVSKNDATLVLHWERKRIPMKIHVDTDSQVVTSLKNQMRGSHGFHYQNFMDAANYLLANELEMELALEWAEIAISRPLVGRRNAETLELKARILDKLGRANEARDLRHQIVQPDS